MPKIYSTMLKRDLRLFIRCLVPALALTLAFSLLCAAAGYASVRAAGSVFVPVRAAVVDNEDSFLSRMLVGVVGDMDYISGLLELERLDMDEAEGALSEGAVAAVIVLPQGFVEDIMRGRESRGRIILSPAAAANAEIVEAAARCGEALLAAGQYAVFSGEELIREHGLGGEAHDKFLERVNLALLGEAVGAQSGYFSVEVTDYAGTSMSTASFYAASYLTLLLFLCSVFFARLCMADLSRPTLCRLRAAGVGDGAFIAGKLLYPTVFRALLLFAALALLRPIADIALSPAALALCALALIGAGAVGAAIAMCAKNAAAVSAALAVAGLFLCGGIVPRQMLPDAVLTLGSLTPFGAVQSLLAPLFGGEASAAGALICAACLALSLLCILRRLSAVRRGGGEV